MMTQRQRRLQVLNNQIRRLENRLAHLRSLGDRFSTIRLVTFIFGGIISAAVLLLAGAVAWAIASVILLVPFIAAVYAHRRVEESSKRYEIWLKLKTTHRARMELDWAGMPPAHSTPARRTHPFALDLDLVGERSLHRLVDTAVSREGSRRLQKWLLDTQPDPNQIAVRQARVGELVRLPLFRDKLILNATLATAGSGQKRPGKKVLDWLNTHTGAPALLPALFALAALAVANVTLLFLYASGTVSFWWPALSWFVYGAIFIIKEREMGDLFLEANFLADSLRQFAAVFHFLETYKYGKNRHLKVLCAPFLDSAQCPSCLLKRVARVVAAAGIRYNFLLWFLVNAFIPWDIYFGYRIHQYKKALSTLLPAWLDVWFELEALGSLATFAYLNPDTVFPEITAVAAESVPVFIAHNVGHPLIPAEERVCNDFRVEKLGTIFIITGSNMAGKSSFLRTLGVNLCLAYAGGTVVAAGLQTGLFRLYTSMRVTDSVTDGFSFFYAEVNRLSNLLQALERPHERPLFYLIDEIFRGTNNRERLIGSQAYVRALAGGSGVGVIATHDLELVRLAQDTPLILNYHFRDDVEDGRMVFDYKLHPGPCPTTNALKIMRLAGLPVESDETTPANEP